MVFINVFLLFFNIGLQCNAWTLYTTIQFFFIFFLTVQCVKGYVYDEDAKDCVPCPSGNSFLGKCTEWEGN